MAGNPCIKIKEEKLKLELQKAFNASFDKILEKNEIKGTNICQIIVEQAGNFGVLYVSSDSKTFFVGGEVYKDGVFLSKAALTKIYERVFLDFKHEIEKIVAFSYKPEGTKKYIYMITDPDCSFCEKAKGLVKDWADARKVEVKVILFPLEKIHPQAKDKSVRGICSGMNYNDYLNSKWDGKLCEEGSKKINDTIALMKKIAVNGTPTFISYNGKRFIGFSQEGLDKIIE
jgi:thiol:disulfide interchange protein DsbC